MSEANNIELFSFLDSIVFIIKKKLKLGGVGMGACAPLASFASDSGAATIGQRWAKARERNHGKEIFLNFVKPHLLAH